MEREIRRVRKKIEQRKKERNYQQTKLEQDNSIFHNTEEKHGYPPEITGYEWKGSKDFVSQFMMKAILAGILFFSTALLMSSNDGVLMKPKEFANQLFGNEFPFAKVNVWYQEVFGSPLAFSPRTDYQPGNEQEVVMPVSGNIVETFQVNGEGVKISPGEEVDVVAHQEGVVVFAGRYGDTGKTITVQHADGTYSSYGNLSDMDVHLYQYVTANQRLGMFTPSETSDAVYFSLEKDNTFLDPVQVIEVDDGS